MTENCSQIYGKCTKIVQKSNLCSIPEQHVVIDHPFFCTQRFVNNEKIIIFYKYFFSNLDINDLIRDFLTIWRIKQ